MRTGGPGAYRDDDTLTVADAARIAQRSVRTIRRAYLSGKLVAHRDGNGRNVSIRYSDLRNWLFAAEIALVAEVLPPPLVGQVDVQTPARDLARTGNLELLTAARGRHRRAARASSSGRAAGRGQSRTA